MDSRLRGNDRVANAVFYYKNGEYRKSTRKQQMHPLGCAWMLVFFSESCGGDVQEFAVLGDGASGEVFNAGLG